MSSGTISGTQLGPYRIEEVIGRGGMGVVYRAHHNALDRLVALKVLVPELAQNPSFRERFVRESQLAAKIDHPNVIPIYDATEIDGTYFIAMRYVDGMDLKELLQGESLNMLDIRRTLAFVSQVAGALDAAHEHGLVHRDVKPGNILVTSGSEHCYLTDFGLTKSASSDTGFTATGHFVGTTDYCAPEQIEGRPIDRRTDVYSLGCVLYECLTGRLPYMRENAMAVMYAHINDAPPSVSAIRRDLPPALDGVIANAMAKDPNHRYPSCSALAADARSALEVGTGRSLPGVPMASGAFTQPEVEAPAFDTPATAALPPTAAAAAHPPAPPAAPPQYAAAADGAGYPPGYGTTSAGWSEPPEPKKGRAATLVAIVVAALLLAAGGTAAALIVTKRDDKPKAPASGPATPPSDQSNQSTPSEQPDPNDGVTIDPGGGDEPPTSPPADAGAEEAAAEAAVARHWELIDQGEYDAAFAIFTTPYTNRNSQSGWVSSHERDGIESASADLGGASVNGSTGTVTLNAGESVDKNGPQCFTGTYDMKKVGGEWRIADSHVTDC